MAIATPNADHVSHDIEMRILLDDGRSLPMPCTLTYSLHDPFAVSATFRSADGGVTWVFARELLMDGTEAPAGEGDIRVAPVHAVGRSLLRITLSSPAGQAVIEGPLVQVRQFLSASEDLLPVGDEWRHLRFDSGLAALLNGEAG